jgi:hypothetical protein
MLDYQSMLKLGKIRHDELIQAAEAQRRLNRIDQSPVDTGRWIGKLMIGLGQRLNRPYSAKSSTPLIRPGQ